MLLNFFHYLHAQQLMISVDFSITFFLPISRSTNNRDQFLFMFYTVACCFRNFQKLYVAFNSLWWPDNVAGKMVSCEY